MDLIFWVKLVHTLIFLFVSSCIFYIIYCGIKGRIDILLWCSLSIVFMVGLTYAVNGFECPLATIVHELAGRKDVADIFFPDWFARNIMPVSTFVYLIGVVLVSRQLISRNFEGKKE